MKEGYIPKEQRKNILLLTDDIRFPSGVGNVGKEIVLHTSHRYNWFNLGAAMNHPDKGKIIDISEETNKLAGIKDASVKIQPNDGYGDPKILRNLRKQHKIDAIFLITDPRYFEWLFQIENEVRNEIPIIYLNIWDDLPAPMYNKGFYESVDTLLGISKQTVNINKMVLGDKAKTKIIDYVPHGMNTEVFHPIIVEDLEFTTFKKQLNVEDKDFILFFNSRNIRRKNIPDTMLSWKYFLDELPKEKADKCVFILHTELVSDHGTDLSAIANLIFEENSPHIRFSTNKLSAQHLNYLYNLADAQILLTSNEGWGLSLTEALLTGTPIIANVTGGMQDQMRFEDKNGNWIDFDSNFPSNHRGTYKKHGKWAYPVYPSSRSLKGSPKTPYIWDDTCDPEDASKQIMKLYKMSPEQRKKSGMKGYKWAIGDEAGFTAKHQAQRVIKSIDKTFEDFQPREKFEFINTNEYKIETVPHKLLY